MLKRSSLFSTWPSGKKICHYKSLCDHTYTLMHITIKYIRIHWHAFGHTQKKREIEKW